MWQVKIDRKALKELEEAPEQIRKKYSAWLTVVQASGVAGLSAINGYRDHPLKSEWKGARSSYLNKSWRVIYRACDKEVTILIVRVSNHDYS